MRRSLALMLLAAAIALPAASTMADVEMAFDGAPVSDLELAGNYGKFIAPGGIDLAMSVQSDTSVNGQLVLRSVFSVDSGPATIQVYAPAPGTQGPTVQVMAGTGQAQSAAQQNQGLAVTIDRSGANTSVQPTWGGSTSAPNVAIGGGSTSFPANNDGLASVAVTAGGPAVETGAGAVSIANTANGARVTLDTLGLSVSHLVGGAAGTVIANSANDRAIDTVTSVQIDIRNAQTLSIGSSLLRIDGIATAATQAMVR